MHIDIIPYTLHFKRAAKTSRNTLIQKPTYFIKIINKGGNTGWGEINLFKGLSADDRSDFIPMLKQLRSNPAIISTQWHNQLLHYPAIRFGVETALHSLQSPQPFDLFSSDFSQGKVGIPINGLIWMGNKDYLQQQIRQKLEAGFSCLKMKIGALDFETEYTMIKAIRKVYSTKDLELRVDANGAFSTKEALPKLEQLSKLQLHSIEQPIRQGQTEALRLLCQNTPLPIALDEELIGIYPVEEKTELLQFVRPQYIILKPALLGGWQASEEWIQAAEKQQIGWWVTSALESNIGLNAIAQWTAQLNTKGLFQGLGTGSLYSNNIASPLQVKGEQLVYSKDKKWDTSMLA